MTFLFRTSPNPSRLGSTVRRRIEPPEDIHEYTGLFLVRLGVDHDGKAANDASFLHVVDALLDRCPGEVDPFRNVRVGTAVVAF